MDNLTYIQSVHELLSLAVDDYKKAISDPFIDIDMDYWHYPILDRCTMCIAGSVIHYNLPHTEMEENVDTFDAKTNRLLLLIDQIRSHSLLTILKDVERVYDKYFNKDISDELLSRLCDEFVVVDEDKRKNGDIETWKTIRDIFIKLDI